MRDGTSPVEAASRSWHPVVGLRPHGIKLYRKLYRIVGR